MERNLFLSDLRGYIHKFAFAFDLYAKKQQTYLIILQNPWLWPWLLERNYSIFLRRVYHSLFKKFISIKHHLINNIAYPKVRGRIAYSFFLVTGNSKSFSAGL